MMNFSNVLQRSFLEGYASMDLQVSDILIALLSTVVLGTYIYVVYKKVNKKSFYNRNFNMSLVALAVITAAIILTIQSNIVVSLGMVGALSIVRFRTAIKDPMDLVFLFWSISVGIICGAGFTLIAIVASVIVTFAVVLFSRGSGGEEPLVLLVNATGYDAEKEIMESVKKYCKKTQVKARNLTHDHLDMAIEVNVKEQGEFLENLMQISGVVSASLVSHTGDTTF